MIIHVPRRTLTERVPNAYRTILPNAFTDAQRTHTEHMPNQYPTRTEFERFNYAGRLFLAVC